MMTLSTLSRSGARRAALLMLPLAAFAGLAQPESAAAQTPAAVAHELQDAGGPRELRGFYAERGYHALWFANPRDTSAAERLIEVVELAQLDGLKPTRYRPRALREAIDRVRGGDPRDVARAEMLFARSFADYVRDLRRVRNSPFVFADPQLAPQMPERDAVLRHAAAAPSLARYVAQQGWMHPVYARLRTALVDMPEQASEARLLRVNLERARSLPALAHGRHILVDTVGARLYMYEDGVVRDSMKVIVGRLDTPTPMLAGSIRFATLNPYWNVPDDLVRERIAPKVLSEGLGYLKRNGFDVLSDWSARPAVADPKLVDWQAVAAGRRPIRVRQRPGAANGMGMMKFTFPNALGIYLHDTPDKSLFRQADRQFSAGCIRVEDARRLARWLYGKPLTTRSKQPELQVALPAPVPVYITYMTAFPTAQRVEFRPDPYGRDLASARGARVSAR